MIQVDSWQRKVLHAADAELHLLRLLSRRSLHRSLNSARLSGPIGSAWCSPTARPERGERERIWSARLSSPRGVIPQINMEIMCRASVCASTAFSVGKTWNLREAAPKDGYKNSRDLVRFEEYVLYGMTRGRYRRHGESFKNKIMSYTLDDNPSVQSDISGTSLISQSCCRIFPHGPQNNPNSSF